MLRKFLTVIVSPLRNFVTSFIRFPNEILNKTILILLPCCKWHNVKWLSPPSCTLPFPTKEIFPFHSHTFASLVRCYCCCIILFLHQNIKFVWCSLFIVLRILFYQRKSKNFNGKFPLTFRPSLSTYTFWIFIWSYVRCLHETCQ